MPHVGLLQDGRSCAPTTVEDILYRAIFEFSCLYCYTFLDTIDTLHRSRDSFISLLIILNNSHQNRFIIVQTV